MTDSLPILWSFRRCPYAMRARLAIASSQVPIEHREILLRDKPVAFLDASPKGTVPVVVAGGVVIEESYDVMLWALEQNDPEGWLDGPVSTDDLIAEADGPFKAALDGYKYASRIDLATNGRPDGTTNGMLDKSTQERTKASDYLEKLEITLSGQPYLFGDKPTLADIAILPFVRQFAHVDLDWFDAQPWRNLARWLAEFKSSDRFSFIMQKHNVWAPNGANN